MSSLDPSDVPAVVEIFSHSSSAWFVGLVVKNANGYLTIRFIDNEGERKEKLVSRLVCTIAAYFSLLGGSHSLRSPKRVEGVVAY